jgi:hypothetical protein
MQEATGQFYHMQVQSVTSGLTQTQITYCGKAEIKQVSPGKSH